MLSAFSTFRDSKFPLVSYAFHFHNFLSPYSLDPMIYRTIAASEQQHAKLCHASPQYCSSFCICKWAWREEEEIKNKIHLIVMGRVENEHERVEEGRAVLYIVGATHEKKTRNNWKMATLQVDKREKGIFTVDGLDLWLCEKRKYYCDGLRFLKILFG